MTFVQESFSASSQQSLAHAKEVSKAKVLLEKHEKIHDDRSDWHPVPYKDPYMDLIGEQHGVVFDRWRNFLSEESQRTVQQKISAEICKDLRNGGWTRGDIFSKKTISVDESGWHLELDEIYAKSVQ